MKPIKGMCVASVSVGLLACGLACSTRMTPLQRLDPETVEVACEDTDEGCPEPESACPEIEPIVDHCPGWATSDERDSCEDLKPQEEGCIADILNELAESGDECINWYEPRIICIGEHIGLEGYASCAIQDCLGITKLEECAAAFEIQCGWTL